MQHLYKIFIILLFVVGFNSSLIGQTGVNSAHMEASSSSGSVSATIGQIFYITAEACGGRAQNGVQQPDFPILVRQNLISATDTSDAYVTISWSVLEECFKDINNGCMPYPDGVLVELMAGNKRIYSNIVYDANGLLNDSFRHFVGPDSTVNYTLNLFIRGSGEKACPSLTTIGSTVPFMPPTDLIVSSDFHPGKVNLSWTNNSQLTSEVLIFRKYNGDSTLIGTVPGTELENTTLSFVDEFSVGNPNNLTNGLVYEYCLYTYNDQLDEVLPEAVCENGNTLDMNLSAMVQNESEVSLSWNDLSNFSAKLRIRRDGVAIKSLEKTAVAYTDPNPTFGIPSNYTLELIDAEGQVTAADTATISFAAIGQLSGFVRTPKQIGIAHIPVIYEVQVQADTLRDTTYTDYRGYYQFNEVFFGRRGIFRVDALDRGRFSFNPQTKRDTLSNENPIGKEKLFISRETYPVTTLDTINIDTVITEELIDQLAFSWQYRSTSGLRDTLHFQLYREKQLIDITDDQQPMPLSMMDLSGSAGYIYQYKLVAYGFKQDSVVISSRTIFDTIPVVEPPYNLIGNIGFDGMSDNVMTLSWNHDSENFSGFRLYRDDELIAVLDTSARFFYDYYAEPGQQYEYMLTAFRKAAENNDILESESVESGPLTIPALPLGQSLTATPLPNANAIELTWSLPQAAANYDNLSGFLISRNGTPVKSILKQGQNYTFRDYEGVPGVNTTYEVQAFLYTPDTTFLGTTQAASSFYPLMGSPVIDNISSPGAGILEIMLDPAYQQQYTNYDGFVLTANGTPFDTLRSYETKAFYTPNIPGGVMGVAIGISAYRKVNGNTYLSTEVTQNANITAQAGAPLDSIENFVASREFPMHVSLKWDFPDYIFATFSIYRDGVFLDTLPYTARNFYDYEAVPGERHFYSIVAENEGRLSPRVSSTGIRRGDHYIHGQLLANRYTSDRNAVLIELRDEASDNLLLRTLSDSSGYFRFDRLHNSVGSGSWKIMIDDTGGGHQLVMNNKSGLNSASRVALFEDNFTVAATPPLPFQDSITFINAFQLNPFPEEQSMVASWSLTEGNYDESILSRGFSEISIIDTDNQTFFVDTLGVSATTYPYIVKPSILENGIRLPEAEARAVFRNETYPVLPAVECLSGLPNLDYVDNTVTLRWSHFNNKVSYYEIRRNGLPIAFVRQRDTLAYVDALGKPDQTYIYEVTAVRTNSSGVSRSETRQVTVVFPEVARPKPLLATSLPDSNAVKLSWSYNGNEVSGFRIFRNGIPLADVSPKDRSFMDFTGIPFSRPAYSLVAFVEREGMLYQSRESRATIDYPAILPPLNPVATSNAILGVVEVSFQYEAQGVDQFKIRRRPALGGISTELNNITYRFNGEEQTFTFIDVSGTPSINYVYEIEALSRREGVLYESTPAVSNTIVYPSPPAAANLNASIEFSNRVDLKWQQDLDANVDGYLFDRTYLSPSNNQTYRDTFIVYDPGRRSYSDAFFPFPELPNTNMTYEFKAFRDINGQRYYSPPLSVLGKVVNPGVQTQLINVIASKGTYYNRTLITWDYSGDLSMVQGFNVYRKDERIATLANDDVFYNDSDGTPGEEYVYTVKAVLNDLEDTGLSDIGYTKGAGQLEGEVVTLQGNAPIEGAKLVAQGDVNGERYIYTAESDNNGKFIIPSIFIGEEPVNYTLSVSFQDHVFVEGEKIFNLSPANSTRSEIFFFDSTAYVAVGRLTYANTDCGIDSLTVRAKHFLEDGRVVQVITRSNENGDYSLVLNPYLSGLDRIVVEVDSIFTRNQGVAGEQRILHRFINPRRVINTPIPRLTEFNFVDGLTYDVEIAVQNVCGFAASSNARFEIEIGTRDGCFKTVKRTELNGRLNIKLPPLDGLIARVVGAAPLSLENNLIVNYLEYRPTGLELATLHIENTGFNSDGNFVQQSADTLVERKLVYHKPATISVASEFGKRPSCDPDQPRILEQNSPYSIRFDVTELHQGAVCDVTEGYLIVNNAAAKENNRDTLFYIPETGRFERHNFLGGSPNLVAPYRKGINIQYFSDIGDLLAERTIPVIVLGAAPLPGSDIIVDVEDDQGQVKMPIYILRDPPGDGSSSKIEEETTVKKSLTDVFSLKSGIGVETDLTLALFGAGAYLEIEQRVGGGFDRESSYEISFKTKQAISTSSSADFVGPDADVMVGIGVAIQYGLIEEIRFDESTCELKKVQSLNISPNEIKTDWNYTVGQIKQIAKERRAQADSVRAGTLEIQVGGNILSEQLAIERLINEAENWDNILEYHDKLSVPFYQFCAEPLDADRLWAEVVFYGRDNEYKQSFGVFGRELDFSGAEAPSDYVDRVEAARESRRLFCADPSVGSYNELDSFILAQDIKNIIFTTDLAAKYENAARAVNFYLDSLYLSVGDIESKIAQSIPERFIPTIENTTFSAGVDIEKTTTISRSTSSTFKQRGFFTLSTSIGTILGTEASVGFGLITKSVDVENKLGVGIDLEFEWGKDFYEETGLESAISYTFSDDDPGDQFSVTAIQARDPGHTPYFQLLGGRSSCPPEEGAIQRDRFDISLYDPETQATFDFQELRELNPNEPATFWIQLTNLNPFGEQRDFFIYHEGESNENGAALKLNGAALGGGNQTGQTLTFINPNQPVILPLTLTRSARNYQFDSIYVVLRPSCTDGDLFLLGVRDTVTISAFFQSPCSDISIASPGNDWVIARRNPFMADSREAMVVEITDYDANNAKLKEIYLEYRRIGDGSGWNRIPLEELEPDFNVTKDSLASYNAANFGPGEQPIFFFTWDITGLYNKYPDGEYEVRAISACGTDGVIQSNIIRGKIRRQTDDVFALTEPADGIWQPGDEISLRINKELDCSNLGNVKFEIKDKATGTMVPGNVFCFPNDNKLIFSPTDPTLFSFDDNILQAVAYDLMDEVGNVFPDTFRWEFRVIARDIFIQDDSLDITIYQGSTATLSTRLFYNDDIGFINFTSETLQNYPWLTVDPSTGTIPAATGREVLLTIDAANLPVGDTTAVVIFLSTSELSNQGSDELKLKVKVLAKPPYWVVDPSNYSTSMFVIGNYRFINEMTTSTDSMDIMSVFIDNEIRGVAKMGRTTQGNFASAIFVYGEAEDEGKPLEFRVWDANEGIEYNAYPFDEDLVQYDSIFFKPGERIGTFAEPEIVVVNKLTDKARYIPLNADSSWTWFSINSQEPDMSVNHILRELTSARDGDFIMSNRGALAAYVPGSGKWESISNLESFKVENGYRIFLSGPDNDTIRITGRNAVYSSIGLSAGFNLIGYPLQDTLGINVALASPTNFVGGTDGDFIFTIPQDPSKPGLSTNMLAIFNGTQWDFNEGDGMEVMRPFFGYQLFVANDAAVVYPGSKASQSESFSENNSYVDFERTRLAASEVDPDDPNTWAVDPSQFPMTMIITAELSIDGQISSDTADMVAAFIDGECRGLTKLGYVKGQDKYYAVMFIYGDTFGEEVDIRFYDASTNRVLFNKERVKFVPSQIIGRFSDPYNLENKQFKVIPEIANNACQEDENGQLSITNVEGMQQPFSFEWSTGDTTSAVSKLANGTYTVKITDAEGFWLTDTLEVLTDNTAIPLPTVSLLDKEVICIRDEVKLQASTQEEENLDLTYLWYNGRGKLLHQGDVYTIASAEKDEDIYVESLLRVCPSERVHYTLEVQAPYAVYHIEQPFEQVFVGDTIGFKLSEVDPAYNYEWDFGDEQFSIDPEPKHVYQEPGAYQVKLEVIDQQGCTEIIPATEPVIIQAVTNVENILSANFRVIASPNPFLNNFILNIHTADSGKFNLRLRDTEGRLIWKDKVSLSEGENELTIGMDQLNLSDGIYLMEVEGKKGQSKIIKLLKAKP